MVFVCVRCLCRMFEFVTVVCVDVLSRCSRSCSSRCLCACSCLRRCYCLSRCSCSSYCLCLVGVCVLVCVGVCVSV